MEAPPTITCVDCGGVCHLLTVMERSEGRADDEGDVAVYRCEDCLDRWDMELPSDDE